STGTRIGTDREQCVAGARRGVRLNSRQPSFIEVPMRVIGLAVVLALSLALAALAAEAQPAGGKVYRIGLLQASPNNPALNYTETFRQGLRDHGYVEGKNIVIEHRVSRAPKDNPALLADLLGRKIDILVTWTTPALVAAQEGHEHDPDRRLQRRPDPDGSGRESGAARRQYHRSRNPQRRTGTEEASV